MITINLSELLLTILSFFLLLFLLRRFLFKPLGDFMEARRERIAEGLAREREALAAVEAQEKEHEALRRKSLTEARQILDEAKNADAERHARSLIEAREQALERRKAAEEAAMERSAEEARELETHRDRLAALLAERLLRGETVQRNPDAHQI